MKRAWMLVLMVVLVFGLSAAANAALTLIGTATYQGNNYKMIYLDDGPFGPITWLDYTRGDDTWENQVNWASGLGADLTVTLYTGYTSTIDWNTGWRLPLTDESQANLSGYLSYEGPDASGYHDYRYGYNMVNSEVGYLYYEELGNKGYYATDGTHPQPGWGPINTSYFNNVKNPGPKDPALIESPHRGDECLPLEGACMVAPQSPDQISKRSCSNCCSLFSWYLT